MAALACATCGGTVFNRAALAPTRPPGVCLRCYACGQVTTVALEHHPRATARATRDDADIAERETDHQAALDDANAHGGRRQ